MRYLLDTHIVLWFAENPGKLPARMRDVITCADTENFVSIVSAWEVQIKLSTGNLKIEGGIDGFFSIISENGFRLLGVEDTHIRELAKLPPLHGDPFDRMLISTAISEGMTLLSADENILKYNLQ